MCEDSTNQNGTPSDLVFQLRVFGFCFSSILCFRLLTGLFLFFPIIAWSWIGPHWSPTLTHARVFGSKIERTLFFFWHPLKPSSSFPPVRNRYDSEQDAQVPSKPQVKKTPSLTPWRSDDKINQQSDHQQGVRLQNHLPGQQVPVLHLF